MTEEHKASRTIVKSPPELWAECSVAQSLARHLGEFGEIRITRLEPETTVAWEGEHASGTVRLEPSGWGTQVTLTATPIVAAMPEPVVEAQPEVEPGPEPMAVEPEVDPEPMAIEPEVDLEPVAVEPEVSAAVEHGEATEDPSEDDGDRVPRWGVFARLWGRLGRKPLDVDDEHGDDELNEPEAVEAVEAAAGPDDDAAELVEVVPEAELVEETPEPEAVDEAPEVVDELDHQALLVGALDSLGQAHHRPFSRA
jgi:hypothetical protein